MQCRINKPLSYHCPTRDTVSNLRARFLHLRPCLHDTFPNRSRSIANGSRLLPMSTREKPKLAKWVREIAKVSQRRQRDLNPRSLDCQSYALTTEPPPPTCTVWTVIYSVLYIIRTPCLVDHSCQHKFNVFGMLYYCLKLICSCPSHVLYS